MIDFLICGFPKTSTSSVAYNLNKHDDINSQGELNVFARNSDGIIDMESQYFDDDSKVCGEKQPGYVLYKNAMDKIYEYNSDMKIVIVLRDPIYRCLSEWKYRGLWTFRKYYNMDMKNKNTNFPKSNNYTHALLNNFSVRSGYYIDFIEKNLDKFNDIHFFVMEKDLEDEYNKLFKFLGVEPTTDIDLDHRNKSRRSHKIDKIDYDILYERYEPYNERLFNYLGYRIEEWDYKKNI